MKNLTKKKVLVQATKDGGLILLDKTLNATHILNSTSAFIYNLLDSNTNIDIAKKLIEGIDENINIDEVLEDVNFTICDFIKKGLLIDNLNNRNEKRYKKISNAILKSIYIEIISYCNQRCIYCYNSDTLKNKDMIDIATFKSIIDQCFSDELDNIILSGGEPMLHPNINEMLDYCNKMNIKVNIISNATLINDDVASLLSKYNPGLQFTIDGGEKLLNDYSRGKGTFEKQLLALENLKKHGYDGILNLRANIWRDNATEDNIRSIIEFCKKYKIKRLDFVTAKKTNKFNLTISDATLINNISKWIKDNNQYNINITYDEDKPMYRCELADDKEEIKYVLRIASNGDVFPCQFFTSSEFAIGNIYENNLDSILNSDKNKNLISLIKMRRFFINECEECVYSNTCHAGCPAKAYISYGNIFRPDGSCKKRKTILEEYYINR